MLKKVQSWILVFMMIVGIIIVNFPVPVQAAGTIYYVSSSSGLDTNNGTSSSTPWKTLVKASSQAYVAGDQILLKRGDTWTDEGNTFDDGYYSASRPNNYYKTGFRNGSTGSSSNPIILGAYGTGEKPVIKGTYTPNYSQYNSGTGWGGLVAGFNENDGSIVDYFCVFIQNPNGWKIQDLKLSNAQGGIVLWNNAGYTNDGTWVDNIDFADIDGIDFFSNDQPDGTNAAIKNSVHFRVSYSAGVILTGDSYQGDNGIRGKNIYLSNLRGVRTKCLFMPVKRSNNSWEIYPDGTQVNYQNVNLSNSSNTGGTFGWWMTGNDGGTVDGVVSTNSGESPYSYGPTGGGMCDVKNMTVKNCEFIGAQRNTVDGCGLDFEGNCENVLVQDCLFKNNHSGGIMYFGTNSANRNTDVDRCTFIQDEARNFDKGEVFISVTPDANSSVTNCVFEKAQGLVNISGSISNSGNVNTVSDIIIADDTDAASTSYVGSWADLSSTSYSDQSPFMFGAKSAVGGSGAYMTFNPIIPTAQKYNVYAWWTESSNHSTATPYTIFDGVNSFTVNVNQTTNGGKWNLLGTYALRQGSSAYVKVDASSGGYAIADAIKLVPVVTRDNIRTDRTVMKFTNEDPTKDGFMANSCTKTSTPYDSTQYTINSADPYIYNDSISTASSQKHVFIKMKNNTAATQGKIYYKTSSSNSWEEAKSMTFAITANDSEFKTYEIDMTNAAAWTNTITGIRFDIESDVTSGTFNMAEIYLINGDLPQGFTSCANEGDTYALPARSTVAYGANGSFFYKFSESGSVTFNNSNFGDPIPNTAKFGFYKFESELFNNDIMLPNECLSAADSSCFLRMQSDGNLVLYTGTPSSQGAAIWSSGTSGNNFLKMQSDGDLCIYAGTPASPGACLWASNTNSPNARFTVQADGNLCIYNRVGQCIWASGSHL